jgi:hypothetical protein
MKKTLRLGLSLLAMAGLTQVSRGLSFNFIAAGGTSQQAIDGFTAAGNMWSSLFSDNIVVNINIAFPEMPLTVLGSASSTDMTFSYSSLKAALIGDATSASDAIAVGALPASSLDAILNLTASSPTQTPFLDANASYNNKNFYATTANLKALGLLAGNAPGIDANISFNSLQPFDFDRSNGISPGAFDFIGIAAHEIGHALGFVSGVDLRDYLAAINNTVYPENTLGLEQSLMDWFRFSNDNVLGGNLGPLRDWTVDSRDKYFSIDGGATAVALTGPMATFSEGAFLGDGRQASHWKDSLGLGIMDPTFATGELGIITANDIIMFDVLGYDLVSGVPEASTVWAGLALVGLGAWHLRRRQAAA